MAAVNNIVSGGNLSPANNKIEGISQNRRVEKQNTKKNSSADKRKEAKKAYDEKIEKSRKKRLEFDKKIRQRRETRQQTDLVRINAANDTKIGLNIDQRI